MSNALNIVNLDRAALPIALPNFSFPHRIIQYDYTAADQVSAYISKADIVITNKVRLSAQDIAAAPNLRIIGVPAIGVDHIDQVSCAERNITVLNAAGYASEGVAEHAIMLMLMLRRHVAEYHRAAMDGSWSGSESFCYFGSKFDDLRGQTLGIVGGGGIGQALARMARGLGMQVIFAERKNTKNHREGYCAFDEALRLSDVLALCIPLTAETQKIINSGTLSLMKPNSILINTGRGGLVDEAALLEALQQQTIAAAGLDVLSIEPPPKDHPLVHYKGDNLLITPHSAWLGTATLQKLVGILHEKIEAAVLS